MALRGVARQIPLKLPARLAAALLPVAILLLVNLCIVGKLAGLEYSANLAPNDPSFMALARGMLEHPRDLLWWPYWDCGIPFQNTYFPLVPAATAAVSLLTGASIPHAFHAASAIFFSLGPVFLYAMAAAISRRRWTSFLCALTWSLLSTTAFVSRSVRVDQLSLWNLRRLHLLVFYGEAPEMAAVALLPLAVLFLYLALTRRRYWLAVAAGLCGAAVTLANAFGAVMLALAAACLLCTVETKRFWRNAVVFLAIAGAVYLWISPLVPPSVLRAIQVNSPTVDTDYRFTVRCFWGACILLAVLAVFWRLTRYRLPALIRAVSLFTGAILGIAYLGIAWRIHVLPQSHRYLDAADPALSLLAGFAAAALLERFPIRWRYGLIAVLAAGAALQFYHVVRYGWNLVRPIDITQTTNYKIVHWLDTHLPGQRVMISASHSYLANVLTDIPQLRGGHDPTTPNFVSRIAAYAIYSGHDPGLTDGEFAVLWLKTLGARAITVPGPSSSEYFRPFLEPAKFDGLLPVLWRENGDTIYAVPSRSASLAHVVPPSALVERRRPDGVDATQLKTYVDALENPAYPLAEWTWEDRHTARIRTRLSEGQVISVQVNYRPGWRASVRGTPQHVRSDALGLIVVEPSCRGECDFLLRYDGGAELLATCIASDCVTLLVLALAAFPAYRSRVRTFVAPQLGHRYSARG